VHSKGALLVVSIAEALSLGIMKPPQEADIVSMETQSFGVPLGYGGPYAGVMATKEKFVRQMPGRLVGETKDTNGKRGFVLTLSTREQHIRREKATSNICTNQALIATMATIYMTIYGREGLKELAQQNLAKAAYAAAQFGKKATRHVNQNEGLIFECSSPGKKGYRLPPLDVPEVDYKKALGQAARENLGNMPEVSEMEIIRHFTRLSTWNYAIDLGMYPLGS